MTEQEELLKVLNKKVTLTKMELLEFMSTAVITYIDGDANDDKLIQEVQSLCYIGMTELLEYVKEQDYINRMNYTC